MPSQRGPHLAGLLLTHSLIIYLSTHPSVHPSTCLPIYLSIQCIHQFFHPSTCPPIYLSFHPPVHPVCPPTHLPTTCHNKHLLHAYSVLSTLAGAGDRTVNKTDEVPQLSRLELAFLGSVENTVSTKSPKAWGSLEDFPLSSTFPGVEVRGTW